MGNGFKCKIGLVVLWLVVVVHRHYIDYVNQLKMEVKNVKGKLY